MDPIFWVAHGAVERLYQRTIFEGVLTDDSFSNSKRGAPCPGDYYFYHPFVLFLLFHHRCLSFPRHMNLLSPLVTPVIPLRLFILPRLISFSYNKQLLTCLSLHFHMTSVQMSPVLGHESTTTKNWLMGFYFADESIDATTLTNIELAEILDPRGDKYRDLLNTVYDSSEYPWCG